MTLTIDYSDALSVAGTDLGFTEWFEISQERVQLFADATDDQQWIHVDPKRAVDGPFGSAVAHGYLTLSLTVKFWSELFDVTGVGARVNYGLDKVRFISPVKVGSRVRMGAVIAEVTEIADGYQFSVDQTVEIEGAVKPAVAARGIYRFYA